MQVSHRCWLKMLEREARRDRPAKSISSRQASGHPTKTRHPQKRRDISQHNAFNMNSREQAIQAAIADYNSGIYTSQRAAAKAYAIPRSTLVDRLKGATDAHTSHQHQQKLTPDQEEFLADWILEEDARGYPPSHARARDMANRILRMNRDPRTVGQDWIVYFIRRNPRVASIVGRKIEAVRSEAATVD